MADEQDVEDSKDVIKVPGQPAEDEPRFEYFLKPGMEHWQIIRGENHCFKGDDGDSVMLTEAQASNFVPKFNPKGVKNPEVVAEEEVVEVEVEEPKASAPAPKVAEPKVVEAKAPETPAPSATPEPAEVPEPKK